jgi:hypothetical protein
MINMSEIEEFQELKNYLINEYRTNGGSKDLTNATVTFITNELDNLKKLNAMKKELEELKSNNKPSKPSPTGAINQSRENEALAKKAAGIVGAYLDYNDPPFDMRSLEDERYARDNAVLKATEGDPRSVVILRDEEGRLA